MFKLHPQLATDTLALGQFELSLVLLQKDANYPWCVLVPKRMNVREIHHLSEGDQVQLVRESSHLAEVMSSIFAPTSMNIAELGNIVPQLHIHHVARFEGDPAWPGPIWGAHPPLDYSSSELEERIARLRDALHGENFTTEIAIQKDDSESGRFTP